MRDRTAVSAKVVLISPGSITTTSTPKPLTSKRIASEMVSPLAGNSFSITGEAQVFERTLDESLDATAELAGELSTRRLPDELRDSVEAITFSPGEPLR